MRIGIISEGTTDQIVIKNIIKAILEDFEWTTIKPDLQTDETDIHLKNAAAAGGLSGVKKGCEDEVLLAGFFDQIIEDKDFLIIQIDTAEIEEFGVVRPGKKDNENYVSDLRENAIGKIKEWINNPEYDEKLVYAISIEELEAWLLTIYEKRDSVKSMSPKERLQRIVGKKGIDSSDENYGKLSKDFKKKKKLIGFCKNNESLLLFVQDLEQQIESED